MPTGTSFGDLFNLFTHIAGPSLLDHRVDLPTVVLMGLARRRQSTRRIAATQSLCVLFWICELDGALNVTQWLLDALYKLLHSLFCRFAASLLWDICSRLLLLVRDHDLWVQRAQVLRDQAEQISLQNISTLYPGFYLLFQRSCFGLILGRETDEGLLHSHWGDLFA